MIKGNSYIFFWSRINGEKTISFIVECVNTEGVVITIILNKSSLGRITLLQKKNIILWVSIPSIIKGKPI